MPQKLPITTEGITLTYYMPLNAKVTKTCKTNAEVIYYQEMEKRTGIKTEFIHPAMGGENEFFNLMVASGDLPDMIYKWWGDYPGGWTKALLDGVGIDLKEPINKWGPNILKVYEQWPEVLIDSSTDDGQIFFFPVIYVDMEQTSQYGFFMRQDWLDKLELQKPETIDEWYTVLTAIRTQDPNGNGKMDEIPVTLYGGTGSQDSQIVKFAQAWKLEAGFVNWDGKAIYSPMEPGWKEFIGTMAKWYAEGLIDPEYLTNDQKAADDNMGTSLAACAYERNSKTVTLMNIFKSTAPEAVLKGVKVPVLNKGDPQYNISGMLTPVNRNATTITKACKYVEEAVRWLDYGYGEEGYFLSNWGPEGSEMTEIRADGLPYFTDYVKNNPDGLSVDEAVSRICPGAMDSPRRVDPRIYSQRMMTSADTVENNVTWDTGTNFSCRFPNISFTAEESAEVGTLFTDINTYKQEMMHKFIMGQLPMSDYDTVFIKTIEDMGVRRVIEIYQAALDRYFQRGK